MLFFQNLVDENQMPKPQKYTDTFILTKKLFIVGLRGRQNISIPVERPCIFCVDIFQVLNEMKGTYMNNKNKKICKEKFELMYAQVKDVSKVSKLEKKFSRSLSPGISMLRHS